MKCEVWDSTVSLSEQPASAKCLSRREGGTLFTEMKPQQFPGSSPAWATQSQNTKSPSVVLQGLLSCLYSPW